MTLTTIYLLCSLVYPEDGTRVPISLGIPDLRGMDYVHMQFGDVKLDCDVQQDLTDGPVKKEEEGK
jgi:hypothetical protein